MSKTKNPWQYAVFRWCVYQAPLLAFGIMLKEEVFAIGGYQEPYEFYNHYFFSEYAIPMWILIFAVPAVWVWRKPLFSWLNKKAEEG